MSTAIKPLDSVTVTPVGAGVVALPTTYLDDYDEVFNAPLYVNIYVSGAGNCFIQVAGSSEVADGRYIASGGSAQYGPVKYEDLPQLYFDAASTAHISYDVLASEG